MALKSLMLRKKISDAQKSLEDLRKKEEGFTTREAELESAIAEATTEEEKATVEESVTEFEKEKAEHEAAKKTLDESIETLSKELEEEERKAPAPAPKKIEVEERKGEIKMDLRKKISAWTAEERHTFMENENVRSFVGAVKNMIQSRSVTNADVNIPTEVLPLLVDKTEQYSKLMKHINVKNLSGKARVRIQGTIPEGVWTEMGGKINELALGFSSVDLDGFKVAGFFAIDNYIVEDSDLALLETIIETLSQAIALAIDKAILYGTGTKMPLGIVTRLVRTTDNTSNHGDAGTFVDLHTSNVQTVSAANSTGIKLFQNILTVSGNAKANYSNGSKFWAMNETTLNKLKAEALSINAAGAIVSGMDNTMPVVGGAVETLSFIPDNVIIGGYGDLYTLLMRKDTVVTTSSEFKFTDDQTVAKGVARADGQPIIPAGFVAIGINATTVSATGVTFATDTANAVEEDA